MFVKSENNFLSCFTVVSVLLRNCVNKDAFFLNKKIMRSLQPQVEVKSFPAEPIGPLAANSEGTYLLGGGVSGEIYLWEVSLCV